MIHLYPCNIYLDLTDKQNDLQAWEAIRTQGFFDNCTMAQDAAFDNAYGIDISLQLDLLKIRL